MTSAAYWRMVLIWLTNNGRHMGREKIRHGERIRLTKLFVQRVLKRTRDGYWKWKGVKAGKGLYRTQNGNALQAGAKAAASCAHSKRFARRERTMTRHSHVYS